MTHTIMSEPADKLAVAGGTLEQHPALVEEHRPGVLGQLREIATDLYQYRELLLELSRRDIRIRYKQAAMGFGWAIFMPILVVFSGCLVRFAMSQVSGTVLNRPEIAAIAIKGIAWSFIVGTISFATQSLTMNVNLVSKVYFPREVLPLSSLLAQSFDTSIGIIALALTLPFLGVGLTTGLLWVPPLLLMLFMITAGSILFLSCANLFFRDVKYIVQVLLTFGIFFTPVFFEPAMFGPTGARVLMLNPVSPVLEGLRLAVINGQNLFHAVHQVSAKGQDVTVWTPWYLVITAAWGIFGLTAAALFFHRSESAFAENI